MKNKTIGKNTLINDLRSFETKNSYIHNNFQEKKIILPLERPPYFRNIELKSFLSKKNKNYDERNTPYFKSEFLIKNKRKGVLFKRKFEKIERDYRSIKELIRESIYQKDKIVELIKEGEQLMNYKSLYHKIRV